MIEKICRYLVQKMQQEMPDIDAEKAEVLQYGLEMVVGEVPKIFLLIAIAFLLGVGWLTLLAYVLILPYKVYSGGIHLKTHLGCILATTIFYCGNAWFSQMIVWPNPLIHGIGIVAVWLFGMRMCQLYAPADTENVPILGQKERQKKKKLSYVTLTISLLVSFFIPNVVISNILWIGMFLQSCMLSRVAYRLTKNQYGHEVYPVKN